MKQLPKTQNALVLWTNFRDEDADGIFRGFPQGYGA